MLRVRIWVSASREIDDAFVVEQIGGTDQYYAFKRPAVSLEYLGTGYTGPLWGFPGTFYDLPRGFPANDADAARRMRDPSISNAMRVLIRSSFPLRPLRELAFEERRIA